MTLPKKNSRALVNSHGHEQKHGITKIIRIRPISTYLVHPKQLMEQLKLIIAGLITDIIKINGWAWVARIVLQDF